jgi:hypothetical protein
MHAPKGVCFVRSSSRLLIPHTRRRHENTNDTNRSDRLLRGIDNFAVGLERSQPDRWDNRLPRPSISFAILPIMFFLRTHETEET